MPTRQLIYGPQWSVGSGSADRAEGETHSLASASFLLNVCCAVVLICPLLSLVTVGQMCLDDAKTSLNVVLLDDQTE